MENEKPRLNEKIKMLSVRVKKRNKILENDD